jgi:prepilin-type N-terminal cleavage/methylation domain-containing protein
MKRPRRKDGYTLVEIIAVMTLLSFIMSVAVAWIIQTMRFDSAIQRRLSHHGTMLRLDEQLRNDIRHGQAMSIGDEDQLIISVGDGRSVTYQISEHRIDREQLDGRSVGRRESFRLMGDHSARWDKSAMPESIGLIVRRSTNAGNSNVIDLHIRGTVDSDRWLQPMTEVDP